MSLFLRSAALFAAVLCGHAAMAAETMPVSVFVDTCSSPVWRTAPGTEFDVPVSLPDGASSATLVVSRRGYSRTYPGLTEGTQRVSLPPAASDADESVYVLTLSFDDPAGTVRTARLGLVRSAAAGGEASSLVRSQGKEAWSNVADSVVLPVPAGTSSLTVDGVEMDTGLNGAAGWFLFGPAAIGRSYALRLEGAYETAAEATLRGVSAGFIMLFR